jgi:hypothetical protein
MLSTLPEGPWGRRLGDTARLRQGDPEIAPWKNYPPSGAEALSLTLAQALELLGETTCDDYLNGTVYWRSIPAKV